MEDIGDTVSFLGLIDSPGPRFYSSRDTKLFSLESEKSFIREFLPGSEIERELEGVTNINDIWPLLIQYLEASDHIDSESIKKLIIEFEAHFIPLYHQQSIGQLIRYLNTARTFHNARALYIPTRKIHAPVHYDAASQSKEIKKELWDEFCRKPINFHEIIGDHYSILQTPYVVSFARIFNATLQSISNI